MVERRLNRLKRWRGLATRYEKRAVNYRAMLVIASIVLWLEGRFVIQSLASASLCEREKASEAWRGVLSSSPLHFRLPFPLGE